MTRKHWPKTRSFMDELAEIRGLDVTALRIVGGCYTAPKSRFASVAALLLQAVAYRLQERVFGGLRPSTRRLLERAAEDSRRRRTPTETPARKLTPGSVLIREWH
jgi:hypothetical protein